MSGIKLYVIFGFYVYSLSFGENEDIYSRFAYLEIWRRTSEKI